MRIYKRSLSAAEVKVLYSSGSVPFGAVPLVEADISTSEIQQPSVFVDPAFRLEETYVFPNPATGEKRSRFHIECGIADSIELRIYNVTGDLIHEARFPDRPMIINNKYAYEYSWDSSDVASGVYVYTAAAKKSGEKDLKVTKKLAIVK